MTYYIKGGSRYNEANPTVWTALNLAGFPDSKYLDANWKQINYESIIDNEDPFWLMGSVSGGAKEFEFGLYNAQRIKIDNSGYWYWDGDSWEDLLGIGGTTIYAFKTITGITNDVVADVPEDTLTLSSANNRLTIVGNSGTDTITFTLVEGNIDHGSLAGLGDDDHPQYLKNVQQDTAPKLGAALDTNGNEINDNSGNNVVTINDGLLISGNTKIAGGMYTGTTDPTNTNRLNYDGYFYATRVYNAVYN